jgi:hypothetical protein
MMMKRMMIVCLFIGTVSILPDVFGQAVNEPRPARNLAVWYATQSAPEPLEKAKWALDDINAYRVSIGLTALPETVLTAGIRGERRVTRNEGRVTRILPLKTKN